MDSIPNYSILPVERPDLPTIAQALYASKLSLTINRLLFKDWPNESVQIANYSNAVSSSFGDPMNELLLKVVDDKTGSIVGHVVLTRKNKFGDASTGETAKQAKESSGEEEMNSVPDGMNAEVLKAVAKAVLELDKEMEGIEHLELTHIYVKSPHRNRGIGSKLVQMCLDKAEDVGLPLRLSSEPAAHHFFLGRGFRDTKHVDFDLEKWAEKYSGFGIFRLSAMAVDDAKS